MMDPVKSYRGGLILNIFGDVINGVIKNIVMFRT